MRFPVRLLILVLSLLTFNFSLFTFASPVSAQTPNPYTTPNTNPDVPRNLPAGRQDLHTWTQNVMIEVLAAATCQLTGIDPVNPNQPCLGVDQKTGQIGFVDPSTGSGGGGAIGVMGNLITILYTPPFRTGDYVGYLASNFGIAKPAYAQTTGFDGLSPVLKVWTAFRNIVYLLFVIVFVVIGLAIMLRVKIDPRTVMTIENQIPKLIIGLLLVTFSFAIAGLLIDLMYLSIYLAFNLLANPDFVSKTTIEKASMSQGAFQGQNPLGVMNNLVGFREIVTDASGGVKDIVQGLFSTGASISTEKGPSQGLPIISGLINIVTGVFNFVQNALGALLGWVAGTLALLIIAIAVLWAMFRLWFILLQAYVSILLDVVFAPFIIAGGLFPGSPLGFGAWLRGILSSLSVFPVTIAMFLLARIFMDAFGTQPVPGSSPFVPPLIGNPNEHKAIGSLIALGIILLTPQVLNMMRDLLKTPQFKYMGAVGQAIGVGTGAFPGVMGQGAQIGSTLFGLSHLPGVRNWPIINRISQGRAPGASAGGDHG